MSEHHLVLSTREGGLSVTVVLDAAMNYALAHNGISPLKAMVVENETADDLDDLSIDITLTGPVPGRIATPLRSRLPQVRAGLLPT